jgi:hypothetical protein
VLSTVFFKPTRFPKTKHSDLFRAWRSLRTFTFLSSILARLFEQLQTSRRYWNQRAYKYDEREVCTVWLQHGGGIMALCMCFYDNGGGWVAPPRFLLIQFFFLHKVGQQQQQQQGELSHLLPAPLYTHRDT